MKHSARGKHTYAEGPAPQMRHSLPLFLQCAFADSVSNSPLLHPALVQLPESLEMSLSMVMKLTLLAAAAADSGSTNFLESRVPRTLKESEWKTAHWTSYDSYPRCCAENDNYDPKADKTECKKNSGCHWAGMFAYKDCTGTDSTGRKDKKGNSDGQCTEAFVQKNNIVAFYSTSGDHLKYKDKKITIKAKGPISKTWVTLTALVVDTCADKDCSGCCSTNAGKSTDGFLIDMESETVKRYFPKDFTDPAQEVFSSDIEWKAA